MERKRHHTAMLAAMLAALQLLLTIGGVRACFSSWQRQTAKVDENPMTEWSQWGECDLPCGSEAMSTRSRPSVVEPKKREVQKRPCGIICEHTFTWSLWQEWTNCSQSCGTHGVRSRFRDCKRISDGFVEERKIACSGNWFQTEACNQIECPPVYIWDQWSDWSQCSVTCGPGGTKARDRECLTERLEPTETSNCGEVSNETSSCNENVHCPIIPEWTSWSGWSTCPVTCGSGTVTRTRERRCPEDAAQGLCVFQHPSNDSETINCDIKPCPAINGGWAQWNQWSSCFVTCGYGYRIRNRLCNDPPPSNGGVDCAVISSGKSTGHERCLGGECPVDGQWGSWTWCKDDRCHTSPENMCKAGWVMYCRKCDNPVPLFGGSPCATGLATDRRECWNSDACETSNIQAPLNFTIIGFPNSNDLEATWIRAPYGLQASSFVLNWTVAGTDLEGGIEIPVVSENDQSIIGEKYSHMIRGLAPKSILELRITSRSTVGGMLRASAMLNQSFRVSRVDGGWGEWSEYSACSPTTDCNTAGTYERRRRCDNPLPTDDGQACRGPEVQRSTCFHTC